MTDATPTLLAALEALDAFEQKERGIPQAHIAADLLQELAPAISALRAAREALNAGSVHSTQPVGVCTVPGDAWQPIETAPKDGTQFLAVNHDGEIWLSMYIDRGDAPPILAYRTNKLSETTRYQIHDIDGKRLMELLESSEQWRSDWTSWSRGYEFEPTHWMPLPPRTGISRQRKFPI
jgi:hypothetical protein